MDEFDANDFGSDRDCSTEIDPECECFIPDAEDRSDGGRINGRAARNRIKKASEMGREEPGSV